MLTREQALGFLLSRQGLTEPFATPLEALDRLVAVQTQYAASLPTALASRSKGMTPRWHSRVEDSAAVKTWSLRRTLHAHTPARCALLINAIGAESDLRYRKWATTFHELTGRELDSIQADIVEALREGPLTRPELHARVTDLKHVPHTGWGIDVMGLAFQGRIRLQISGSGPTRFVGCEAPSPVDPLVAKTDLLRAYLSAYGPGTYADFAYWTGLAMSSVKPTFAALMPELAEVSVEGLTGDRWLLTSDVEEAQNPPQVAKIKLLAKFDPLSMGHKVKDLWLDPKMHDHVFRKAGQVEAVVLVRGRAVATWRAEIGKSAVIKIEPFKPLSQANLKAIEIEARRMAKRLWQTPLSDIKIVPTP